MNYPIWDVPASGLLIALVAIPHVFVSHFAIGGGLFLVLAERRARREGDAAFLAYVRSLSRAFVLLTLVFGALTGVGIWFTIGLVNPQGTSALIQTFVWVWAIEWTFFFVEIAASLVYYYGWDRLDARTHLRVGWIYFVAAWLSLAAINGILSYMLTSGAWVTTHRLADAFFNPAYLPTTVLRTALTVGLAGLYALFAAAFLADRDLRARIARWAGLGWVLPAGLASAASFVWTLSVLGRAGVPVAETLGARSLGADAILRALFAGGAGGGHPIVRRAALVALVASVVLALGALLVATLRARRFGRLECGALMIVGLVAMGAGEWVREGLRKPYVIDRVLFVNGVRLPAPDGAAWGERAADPFALDVLQRVGALASSPWVERGGDDRTRGREVFRVQCAACHTEDGHLGMRRLAAGRSVEALERIVTRLAEPIDAHGQPTSWRDPGLRLDTWLGRRMPPFAGTPEEARLLAVYLADLGGGAQAVGSDAVPPGAAAFERHCSACHGPSAVWPIEPLLKGRGAAEMYDLLGRLPEVRAEMPPFTGTDEERRALADHLGALAATGGAR